jgi:hypothetical protein
MNFPRERVDSFYELAGELPILVCRIHSRGRRFGQIRPAFKDFPHFASAAVKRGRAAGELARRRSITSRATSPASRARPQNIRG